MGSDAISCRLCGAQADFSFSRRARDGDEIKCYECTSCHSLQTQVPYWLDDEYAAAAAYTYPNLDTSAAERALRGRIAVCFLWKLCGFSSPEDKLLDWGGGPGLLVRLLRDVGIDAYNYDKYAKNHFASGFSRSDEHRYSFVTAFEVFEHFANPATDLEAIFALQPSFFLISTCIFKNQGPDWSYLGPAKSEHVFFYSERALQLIGRRFGYQVFRLPHEITLFFKSPISTTRLRLANLLLSNDHVAEIAFALKRKWSLSEADNRKIHALIERMDP